ncbi:MAG: hypothetical protein J6P69_08805 [Bacteroidales bacterium]|nr:hypothetical protein [Bacteroidales bacterium]
MKVVAISYEVEVEGEVVDSATSEKPLDYIQGMRMIIPKLEACWRARRKERRSAASSPLRKHTAITT